MTRFSLLLCAIIAFLNAGCESTRIPQFIDPAFNLDPQGPITVVPAVDARKDKKAADVTIESDLRKPIVSALKDKGYTVNAPKSFSRDGVHDSEITEMDGPQLASLAPPDSGKVLVLFLDDAATSYGVIFKSSKVQVSAILVDQASGSILWRDSLSSSSGQGGLISGLIPTQSLTVSNCTHGLMAAFPKQGKPLIKPKPADQKPSSGS